MIHIYATEPQFVDHLAAVWHALPSDERGKFITTRPLEIRAGERGVVRPTLQLLPEDAEHPVLVASWGDQKRVRRAGFRRIAFIEHGAGQSYAGDPTRADAQSYAGGKDRGDASLVMVPNEHAARRWRKAYPAMRVETVGCPKLDMLPARAPGDGPVVAVSFHWDCNLVPETRPAFGYYRAAVEELAGRRKVIGHAHPKGDWPRYMEIRYRRMHVPYVADFMDVCRQADVYVCDNSSTLFEFAATGRPVVVLNQPAYRRGVNHGLRFWDAAEVGVNVWDPKRLPAAIDEALADAPERRAKREAALDIVYAYRTGAAQRAAEALIDWAAERVEAVA